MAKFDRVNDVERTEMVTFDPAAKWRGETPAGNALQKRNDSAKFVFSDTSLIYDWYEAHLVVDALMLKTDGTAATDEKMGVIPGSFSMVEELVIKSGGADLYRFSGANQVLFIRKMLETGLAYSDVVGTYEDFILDSGDKSSTVANNPGLKERTFTGLKRFIIPLNNWGFFKALKDKLLPAIHMSIEVRFGEDVDILFGPSEDGGASNKLIIQDVVMRIPNVFLKSGREADIRTSMMEENKVIEYVQEQMSLYPQQQTLGSKINISEGIVRYLNIFVFTVPTAANTVTTRKYNFNTFNNGMAVELFAVKIGGNESYPDPTGYKSEDMKRMFFDTLRFANRQDDPSSSGVCFSYKEWLKDYGFVHFDMRKTTPLSADAKESRVFVKFTGAATAAYNINIGTIHLIQAIIKHADGRIIIAKIP